MMKLRILMVALSGALALGAGATVVSTGAVRQPVNLGPGADPGRIPIGWVPCESNHGYGVLELIATPFPLIHGGWRWEGGVEMNGNLPSAFGISVEPEDTTNVPASPVVLKVRKQQKPAYSPYSKEQVMLATMRCLLDSVSATTRLPLTVEVVTEDPADEGLKRFAGKYVTRIPEGEEGEPTLLQGCRVEVGPDGVGMIVFEDAAEKKKVEAPLWLPFAIEGDGDSGHLMLPLWAGDGFKGERLELIGRPWPVLQDLFNPAIGGPDANSLTRRSAISTLNVVRDDDGARLFANVAAEQNEAASRELALLCWAAVLSEKPVAERPLKIELRFRGSLEPVFQKWVEEAGWKQAESGSDTLLRGELAWDGSSLIMGQIPGCVVEPGRDGGWGVMESGDKLPETNKELPALDLPDQDAPEPDLPPKAPPAEDLPEAE